MNTPTETREDSASTSASMEVSNPTRAPAQSQSRSKAKGVTRLNAAGVLEYFMDSKKAWVPAVYHEDIRAELITGASQEGAYDHTRKSGLGNADVTSFLASHKSWGEKREQWPEILFVLDIKKAPKPTPALPKKVPLWYRGVKLVLDRNSNPMRDFSNTIPATCSSEMETWLLVAILHTDTRVQIGDIHGRMPNEVALAEDKGTIPLFGMNTISMRMTRFRLEAGLLPREQRSGSDTLKVGYKKILGERCFAENSTRNFGRKLKPEEIEAVKQPNKGKFSQKSKNKNQAPNTEVSNKRGRAEAEDGSIFETQDAHDQGSHPSAKRARPTQPEEGELRTRGTGLANTGTGLLTPEFSASSYPASGTAMVGRITGVSAAANHHQESTSEFLARMCPNLYRAADGTSTYREDGDAGLRLSHPVSAGELSEGEAEFIVRTYHEYVPDEETHGSDGTANIHHANFHTEHGPPAYYPPSTSKRADETYDEFLARMYPPQLPSPETGASDMALSPLLEKSNENYGITENRHHHMNAFNNAISREFGERNTQHAATNPYSGTIGNDHANFLSDTGGYGYGYPVQGASQGYYLTRSVLDPTPSMPGQNDGGVFANEIRSENHNHSFHNMNPRVNANTSPSIQQNQSALNANTEASTTQTSKHRKRSATNADLDASAAGNQSKRQKRSATDQNPDASTTGTRPKRQRRTRRSNYQNRPNTAVDFLDPNVGTQDVVEETRSGRQNHPAPHTDPGASADAIQSNVAASTNPGPQSMSQSVYPGPAELDQLYRGPSDVEPFRLNNAAQHAMLGPYYTQSSTVSSAIRADQQDGAVSAEEIEPNQNPSLPSQPTMVPEDFYHFTHELALDPAWAEVMGLTDQNSNLQDIDTINTHQPFMAEVAEQPTNHLEPNAFDTNPTSTAELLDFQLSTPGAIYEGLPLFGPDGWPTFETSEADAEWDFVE
ncbi:hypothetical protein MMC30_001197 [Trapelia coarctata]|nr:hypothetical protein [Trapelia coarctata]